MPAVKFIFSRSISQAKPAQDGQGTGENAVDYDKGAELRQLVASVQEENASLRQTVSELRERAAVADEVEQMGEIWKV